MTLRALIAIALAASFVLATGCQKSDEEPTPATTRGTDEPASATSAPAPDDDSDTTGAADDDIEARIQGALGAALGEIPLPALPPGLVVNGECPAVAETAAVKEIAAADMATVPLREGLTLSALWRTESYPDDIECLEQIHSVGSEAVEMSGSCNRPDGPGEGARRTCRADLHSARVYHTEFNGDAPVTLVGTTTISLSATSFAELKAKGSTPHRYVETAQGSAKYDLDGVLTTEGGGTLSTIVNDRPVELPVIRATATLRGTCYGEPCEKRLEAAILDDARFPLVLDYQTNTNFGIRYSKISFPTHGDIEEQLRTEKRVDVYGIYFDFASDRIRKESEPVLAEIAAVLASNPEWKLAIQGHTDAVGGAEANLALSNRRSEAVRAALVERGVEADRLSTAGFGASMPKDTNDTPEGRARNRRVELVRQ